ncbi:MAG: hypothetical protein AAFR17_19425 [Pseudomonadota bacterium]
MTRPFPTDPATQATALMGEKDRLPRPARQTFFPEVEEEALVTYDQYREITGAA